MVEGQGKVIKKSRSFKWLPCIEFPRSGKRVKIRKIPTPGNFEFSPGNLKL